MFLSYDDSTYKYEAIAIFIYTIYDRYTHIHMLFLFFNSHFPIKL